MGYEVILKYKEGKDPKEDAEVKEKKITVGQLMEEVSLEVLAGKVMAQLARRNIQVVDVEIFEYTKKKITYKEDEDGIRIKNKKFRFDDGASVTLEDVPEDGDQLQALLKNPQILALLQQQQHPQQMVQPHQLLRQPHPAVAQQVPQPKMGGGLGPPLRYEIFDPVDRALVPIAQAKGWAFTLGKRYPIFGEKPGIKVTDGMLYTVVDDKGKTLLVSDKFFVPQQARLLGEGEFIEDKMGTPIGYGSREPQLDWGGAVEIDMPNLR